MKQNIIKHLAKAIRACRKKAGLSQAELATIAGVGKTVIFDIEHEKPSIRLDTLLKVLHALNIDLNIKTPVDLDHE